MDINAFADGLAFTQSDLVKDNKEDVDSYTSLFINDSIKSVNMINQKFNYQNLKSIENIIQYLTQYISASDNAPNNKLYKYLELFALHSLRNEAFIKQTQPSDTDGFLKSINNLPLRGLIVSAQANQKKSYLNDFWTTYQQSYSKIAHNIYFSEKSELIEQIDTNKIITKIGHISCTLDSDLKSNLKQFIETVQKKLSGSCTLLIQFEKEDIDYVLEVANQFKFTIKLFLLDNTFTLLTNLK